MPEGTSVKPRGRLSSMQIMIAVVVSAMVLGFVGGLARARFGESEGGNLLFGATALAGLVLSCIATVPYWRRLDEAAREAHKDAWLWGGIVGYVAAALYAVVLVVAGEQAMVVSGRDPAEYIAIGIAITIAAQSLCYTVAWGLWWLRRR